MTRRSRAPVGFMARPLRLQVENGIYHVIARGNERRAIYRDDTDRRIFLEIMQATAARFRWRYLSYCLMTNHYHLVLRTLEPNLARGMRDLNGVYAQAFNRRHRRVGHLFQGRYRAILVERDEQLLAVVAYVVRNPVRAGVCDAANAWPWSSHSAALGQNPPGALSLDELLGYFGSTRRSARERYRELVEERVDALRVVEDGVIVGSDEFIRHHLRNVVPKMDVPAYQRQLPRSPLMELLAARSIDAIVSAYENGYTMPAIARELGVHPSTVSRRLSRHRAQIKT